MRILIVKFAGLVVNIHELQQGILMLTHQRPEKKPREYILDQEDFEELADIDTPEAVSRSATWLNASAVGLQLNLVKNEGVLKVNFEGKTGGSAE